MEQHGSEAGEGHPHWGRSDGPEGSDIGSWAMSRCPGGRSGPVKTVSAHQALEVEKES